MESPDRVTLQDVKDVRVVVARMRRRSLLAAGLGGPIFSALVAATWLWLHPSEFSAALFLALITYVLGGLPLLVHWIRHWRKIERQLSKVADRVQAGEVVYGSQVQFR